ncbi:MNIO family bufferin maturase [Photorhabdus sp. SF281]|uniref:MNIO family bufferin maturase n=1 Tax=Photorhabdus sp. SF281 TaxID=3459527 RepID=UPI004044D1D0
MTISLPPHSVSCDAPDRIMLNMLPARAGIGLKPEHFRAILRDKPNIGFFEIHAENYLVAGGPFHQTLTAIRQDYPLSIHGVGLSIGGENPLNQTHLQRVAALVERYQPAIFSEHLAWSTHNDLFLNDLLPLPYTDVTLIRVCEHIDQVQNALRRPILLENPSTYIEFSASTMSETDFISEVIRRTGCGLLLDVNNLYISGVNHNRCPRQMLFELPLHRVGEIHLAGYTENRDGAGDLLLIDSHDSHVTGPVWDLYNKTLRETGPIATLIEWDSNIPPLDVLLNEASHAQRYITESTKNATTIVSSTS